MNYSFYDSSDSEDEMCENWFSMKDLEKQKENANKKMCDHCQQHSFVYTDAGTGIIHECCGKTKTSIVDLAKINHYKTKLSKDQPWEKANGNTTYHWRVVENKSSDLCTYSKHNIANKNAQLIHCPKSNITMVYLKSGQVMDIEEYENYRRNQCV